VPLHHRPRHWRAALLGLVVVGVLAVAPATRADAEVCLNASPDIYDFSAANFYNDALPAANTARNWSRFVIVPGAPLPIIPGAFCTSTVASVSITGPNGFATTVNNLPFTLFNFSGYLTDAGTGATAYTRLMGRGFLANGEYTAKITYTNGVVKEKKRTLAFSADDQRILDRYKAQKANLARTPAAGTVLPTTTDPAAVVLKWKKINTANGPFDFLPPTVHYSVRVSTGGGGNPAAGFWSSSCLLGDLICGLSAPEATIGKPLVKGQPYSWTLDLSDSSAMATQDLVIGTPALGFRIAAS
jgi:hypothetical protein